MFVEELTDLAFGSYGTTVSDETHEITVDHVADTIGALLIGRETLGARLESLATGLGLGAAPGTVGYRRRLALVGGSAVHAWETDDFHHGAMVCPGSVILPALMGAPDDEPALTWGGFLAAYRAGYDVAVAVARAVGASSLLAKGWWPTGLVGPLGGAAALAVARGDRDGCSAAIGIAAQQSGGALAGSVSAADSRYLLAGAAADRAVSAYASARDGWRGPVDFFDAGRTPLPVMGDPADALGTSGAAIGETSFKPFPAAQHLQAAVETLLDLVHRHDIEPGRIDWINCALPEQIAPVVDRSLAPPSRLAALITGPFVLAVAALAGRLTTAEYADERRADPAVLRLAEKIRIVPDAQLGRAYPARWGARVEISAAGSVVGEERAVALGSRENPMRREQVGLKFRRNLGPVLGRARSEEMLATLLGTETTMAASDVLPKEIMRSGEGFHRPRFPFSHTYNSY